MSIVGHSLASTHHADDTEGQAWAEEGPHGLTANWSGPSFWSHGSTASRGVAVFLFFIFLVEESLYVSRRQSDQHFERQIKQITGECLVHSTSYDKGSCFAMAWWKIQSVNLIWRPPSRGGKSPHMQGTRRSIARLNGRDTNKPDVWKRPVPAHQYRLVDHLVMSMGFIRDGPPAEEGEACSVGWLGFISGAGTHKAT